MHKYRDVPFLINVWTKYSDTRLYDNGEIILRSKKNICVFTVTCHMSTKSEIVVPGSGIRFRYLIFENSGKMTNYALFLPSLLSISTKS